MNNSDERDHAEERVNQAEMESEGRECVTHFAGPHITIDAILRQRCAWCGELLIDYALDRIAVPEGTDPTPATWPLGALVAVCGGASWTVPHEDGQPLPDGTCARDSDEAWRSLSAAIDQVIAQAFAEESDRG